MGQPKEAASIKNGLGDESPTAVDFTRGTTDQNQQLDVGNQTPYEFGNDQTDHLDCQITPGPGRLGTITDMDDLKVVGTNFDSKPQNLKYGDMVGSPRIT